MYSPILYCFDDLALTSAGALREATDAEAIVQDLAHMLDDMGVTAGPLTPDRQATARAAIIELLSTHPRCSSIDKITFNATDAGGNTLPVAVYVNGSPTPLAPTTP